MSDEFDAPMELGAALQSALESQREEIKARCMPPETVRVALGLALSAPELLTGDPAIDHLSEAFRIASDKMRPLMYAGLIGAPGAPAVIPRFLCRYCQNWYPASSLIKFGDGLERCEKCQERHNQALDFLAGNPPKECGMCQITFEKLQDRTPGDLVRMKVIMVDGTYVLACDPCYDAFVQASRELYKGTRFGAQRKL
jgi:hypothetical protein